jgi:hypothetical protein
MKTPWISLTLRTTRKYGKVHFWKHCRHFPARNATEIDNSTGRYAVSCSS